MSGLRIVLYVFTASCALAVALLLFSMLQPVAQQAHTSTSDNLAPKMTGSKRVVSEPGDQVAASPVVQPTVAPANEAPRKPTEVTEKSATASKPSAPESSRSLETITAGAQKEEIASEPAVTAASSLQPISKSVEYGDQAIGTHLIMLNRDPTEGSLFGERVIGLTFFFMVLDPADPDARSVQGLGGCIQLHIAFESPLAATVFANNPSHAAETEVKIGRGEILLFAAVPQEVTQADHNSVKLTFTDFLPLNLIEALPEVGSAAGAPVWVEVRGRRFVLDDKWTNHITDTLSEVKTQHRLRWQAQITPHEGIQYVPTGVSR